MAVNQQCLQKEWMRSWRPVRENKNTSGEKEWMDRSEEEEEWENPEKEDEWMEEDLQVDAQESDEAVDDDNETHSISFPVCASSYKASNEEHVEYDNNNNNNSFPVTNSGHLDDDDCTDENNADKSRDEEEYGPRSPVAPANTNGLTAACKHKYKAGEDEEDANHYDGLVAVLENKVNDDRSVKNNYFNINGNEENTTRLPVTSGHGDGLVADIDYYKSENGKDCFAAASSSTTEIIGCEKCLQFKDEEQQVMDCTSEQELKNELEEEEEEKDEDEDDGNYSFEDSDDAADMYPKKLYSDAAYPAVVFQTLENMMLHSVLTDLTLCTEDGHQFHVHSIVLAAVSYFIQARLREKSRKEQFITLCLGPEVHGSALAAVVEFAYTGTISNLNKDNLELVWSAAVSMEVLSILQLCTEEEQREEDKARGKKVERQRISAEEHLSVSLQHIRQLWTQRVGCDVKLKAEGRVFHAHRVILAASSDYFRGMFTSGMKESRQKLVSLLLVLAAKFETLLYYSYSGTLALGWGCVFDLACTCLQLQFQSALTLCFKFMRQEIDANNCLDVASFAEAYGMVDLLVLSNDFVLRNFQDVSVTLKFKDLPLEKLKEYLQSDSLCIPSELPVFKAVMSWIEAFPRQRVKFARELMVNIQFPLMTFQEFKEVKSITSWPRIGAKQLYDSLLEEFCSGSSGVESNFRAYMPKDTIVLVGGERITDNFDKHKPCRDMWFSNSLQNHVGLVKKIEWRELGTLPEKPRFSHGVGVLRGKLYVVGGRHYYGKDDTMNCTYRYDPIQNSWQRLADMNERRGSFTLVVLSVKIYAIGGERNSQVNMESVEMYCPNTNSWSFVHPLDKALCCHAASVWNDSIFLSGGFNSEYQCLSSMILYHPERGSTYLAEMRKDRSQHCMETLGGRLYVAGGVSSNDYGLLVDQFACEVYDPLANSWSAITPFQVPHVGCASAVLEGMVYIIGGYSHEDYSDTKSVHRYNPATERWEHMSMTPGPNTYIAACVLPIPCHLRY